MTFLSERQARLELDLLKTAIRDFFSDVDKAAEDQNMRDSVARFRAVAIRKQILSDSHIAASGRQRRAAEIDAQIARLRAERDSL